MNQSLSLITDKYKNQINNILKNFENYLLTIRTGVVTPHLIDNIFVNYHEKKMKIKFLATIEIKKPNTISIKPWDQKSVKLIEKAILESQENFTPNNNGKEILIKISPPNKESRMITFKNLKKQGESCKISIRQNRKNNNSSVKLYVKNNNLSSSLEKKYLNIIQKLTDEAIKNIDISIEKKKNDE